MSKRKINRKHDARRKNGKKSHGPKTPKGKQKSSLNAVKHGLYAKTIVIDSPHLKEDPQKYLELVDSLYDELKPKGALQEHMVLVIANSVWRRLRVIAAESARVNSQLDDIDPEEMLAWKISWHDIDTDDKETMARTQDQVDRAVALRIGMGSIPDDDSSRNLLRYEMRLDRQISRALRELRRLKAMAKQDAADAEREKRRSSRSTEHFQGRGANSSHARIPQQAVGHQENRDEVTDHNASGVVPGESSDSPGNESVGVQNFEPDHQDSPVDDNITCFFDTLPPYDPEVSRREAIRSLDLDDENEQTNLNRVNSKGERIVRRDSAGREI